MVFQQAAPYRQQISKSHQMLQYHDIKRAWFERKSHQSRILFSRRCPACTFRPRLKCEHTGVFIYAPRKWKKTHITVLADANNKVLSSTFEKSFRHGMCALYPHHPAHMFAGCVVLNSPLCIWSRRSAARESMTNFPTQTFMLDTWVIQQSIKHLSWIITTVRENWKALKFKHSLTYHGIYIRCLRATQ